MIAADGASRRLETARNIILLLGDGMGHAHRLAGQLLLRGRNGRLAMDDLPAAGLMNTVSGDHLHFVTDSAAAATALATGVKTGNGTVAMDLAGRRLPTILELAKRAGKSVGLVTTCQITDATPAAFGAHVPNRVDQSEIARQYLEESEVDLLLGGGAAYWRPAGTAPLFAPSPTEPRELSQGTAGDLIALARRRGYSFVQSASELAATVAAKPTAGERVLGLFANQELFQQRTDGEPDGYLPPVTVAELTDAAIQLLAPNPNGFFLMVEESAVDRMAHRNNAALTLKAVLELDRAVQVAVARAEADPETLVIVTADHECGGLAIAGSDDPPYPYEPGGGLFETVIAGEDGPFPVAGEEQGFVMGWATTGHTAAAVPVTATGPGATRFAGAYENTYPFTVMAEAFGLATWVSAASNGRVHHEAQDSATRH